MAEEELGKKFRGLFEEIAKGYEEISRELKSAIEDVILAVENDITFDALEEEVKSLQSEIRAKRFNILETSLLLKKEESKTDIDIEVKCEKDSKRFRKVDRVEVRDILDLPTDLKAELEKEGFVKFKLK